MKFEIFWCYPDAIPDKKSFSEPFALRLDQLIFQQDFDLVYQNLLWKDGST